ncbi:MAG: beta-galactosidase, partial [Clostridia bacterium]|nr:beta-galactosidase [Clostridia bacterium]
MLNGEWDFSFYDSIYHIPSDCIKNCDEFKSENKIDVPSVWQNYGYDLHQYTNVRYPIPYEPPYVPKMNPCGVYKREFEVKDFEKLYLNFEGVDSCFYLWINKQFVGYSQVSHCTSEFDITQYVNKGINNITVIVLKWCDGTYLEDQDKLRTSGIFRDVFLMYRPQNHIFDYSVTTELNEDYSSAIVNCKCGFSSHPEKIDYSFCDSSDKEISNGTSLDGNIEIKIANPLLWTAETPNLYYLRMKCNGECISQQVGMIDISKKDGILKINNTPIKLHGVNRHDSHPRKGPAVSYEDVLNDILMMKRYNV